MKVAEPVYLVKAGAFSNSEEFQSLLAEIMTAIRCVHWPPDTNRFVLYPGKRGNRASGKPDTRNGVKPIKGACMTYLEKHGWRTELPLAIAPRKQAGRVDAAKAVTGARGKWLAVEWETGNVSSSHRSLNRMLVGLLNGFLAGGILILPTRAMYHYLTDRIGNYEEIEPYFPVWKRPDVQEGVLAIVPIEHDATSENVPRITKGTDGRALL